MFPRQTSIIIAFFAVFFAGQIALAAEPLGVLPYIADDVAAVAYVDLAKIDAPAALERFNSLIGLPAEDLKRIKPIADEIQKAVEQFRRAGIGRVYVLFRVDDVVQGGPTWVAPVAPGKDADAVLALIKKMAPPRPEFEAQLLQQFAIVDGTILLGTNEAQLKMLKASRRNADQCPAEAREALSRSLDHTAGVVLFGDADSRRVIREMFPKLPVPFERIDGRFLADSFRWAGLTVDVAPQLRASLTLQLSDEAGAKTAEDAIAKALVLGKGLLLTEIVDVPKDVRADLAASLELLKPKVDKTVISLTFGDDSEEISAIAKLAARGVRQVRTEAGRNARMNQFKQLGLAFWNYHDRNKTFPPAAICDKDGKPLLSWRVAVLPYLEQNALYKEFHLDEPWDSEHNRKLIERMPAAFADPDPAVRKAIGDKGKTTFVVPTGEGTVFHGSQGMGIRDIKDGTSNTLLAVEVVPERAVIWTKPDDWKVDWKKPLDGIRRTDGRPFTCVLCDGSAHSLRNDIDPKVWKKFLTAAGKEVVNWSEWKK